MNFKQRLVKLEIKAAASIPTEKNPAATLEAYQRFYPDIPMKLNPNFKFKNEGTQGLGHIYDFFENGILENPNK